jgi:cell division protein FtsN
MAKDYVHRSREQNHKEKNNLRFSEKKPQRNKFPFRAIFTLIILLVLFVVLIVIVKKHENNSAPPTPPSEKTVKAVVEQAKPVPLHKTDVKSKNIQNKNLSHEIIFTFYQELPKNKITLVTGTLDTGTQNADLNAGLKEQYQYLLQIASLSNKEKINNIQDKIRLLGFKVKTLPIEKGQETFYRIQLGFFHDLQSARNTQDTLQKNDIPSVLLEEKT